MYVPSSAAGATRDTRAWDAGTQSISPNTKITTTATIAATLVFTSRRSTVRTGLMATRRPQVVAVRGKDVTETTGSTVSKATYTMKPRVVERRSTRKGRSARTIASGRLGPAS